MALAPESASALRLRLEGNLAVTKTYRTGSINAVVAALKRVAMRASSLGLEHYEAIAHHNLGVMYRSLGLLEESLGSLERATRFWQLEPSSPYADNMDLVETLLARHELERAERAAARGLVSTAPWRRASSEAQLGQASVRMHQGRIAEARNIVESVAMALPELGSNRTAVYLALADCYIIDHQPTAATRELIAHLEREADDPRYEGDVATAVVALKHSIGVCDGSCASVEGIIDRWDKKGQHFETVKRRLLVALAATEHGRGNPDKRRNALAAAVNGNQSWYLRHFLRPFAAFANELVTDRDHAALLCDLVRVDPQGWQQAILSALPLAVSSARPQLLDALAADADANTIRSLREVAGRDVEELRARLIRDTAAAVSLTGFGSMRITRGRQDGAAVPIRRPRQRTLLGYLLARVENPPSREQVVEALWPDADPQDALNNLNQTVYQLRRVIDPGYRDGESPPYLLATAETVALDPGLVRTDLQEFRALARTFERGEATDVRALGNDLVDLVDGEFLAELVYEDWANSFRMAVHAEVRQVLMRFSEDPWVAAYPDLALRAAMKLADLDPYDEKAQLGIARSLRSMGRGEAARIAVRRFLTRYHEDLGETPETDFSAFVGAGPSFDSHPIGQIVVDSP
jgi:DNA-binding SARP family transcriptional activator